MEEEIWEIPKIVEANEKSKGKLTASFRAYTEFVESTLSDDELAEMIFGENSDEEEDETLVVAQIGKMQQFTTHLPLYSIRAACGKFTDDEEAEIEGWVNVENNVLNKLSIILQLSAVLLLIIADDNCPR